jgi:all-trans-retinol dehydrogenase (NAD+)
VSSLAQARVLITGAGSGIGRSLAIGCAARGAHVFVADVNADAADTVAATIRASGLRAWSVSMDVSDPAQVRAARARILADGGPIDVLINNAGTVHGGPFTDVPLDRHLATYRVNILGLVTVTHAFLPDLAGRPSARVVNIASAAGFVGLPYGTTYASSKWAVVGFSESLRLELASLGQAHVGVTCVCPSFVSTGLFDGARPPFLTPPLTADRVAAQTIRAIERRRTFVFTPFTVRFTPRLRGVLPRPVFDWIARVFGVNSSMMAWRGRGDRG